MHRMRGIFIFKHMLHYALSFARKPIDVTNVIVFPLSVRFVSPYVFFFSYIKTSFFLSFSLKFLSVYSQLLGIQFYPMVKEAEKQIQLPETDIVVDFSSHVSKSIAIGFFSSRKDLA